MGKGNSPIRMLGIVRVSMDFISLDWRSVILYLL